MKRKGENLLSVGKTSHLISSFRRFIYAAAVLLCFGVVLEGCEKKVRIRRAKLRHSTTVQQDVNNSVVQVDHPESFPLVAATEYQATSKIEVTGSVNPDISRTIPVISIASGRVVDMHARLGDFVKKGQLLMEVQSTDVSGALSTYLKAVNDEQLAKVQLDRATLLFSKGAVAKSQVEIAQNAEDDAVAALSASEEQLRVLGVDKNHPLRRLRSMRLPPVSSLLKMSPTRPRRASHIQDLQTPSRLPTSPRSGLSVMCMKMISRLSAWVRLRRFD